jgi:hypothetical protein
MASFLSYSFIFSYSSSNFGLLVDFLCSSLFSSGIGVGVEIGVGIDVISCSMEIGVDAIISVSM